MTETEKLLEIPAGTDVFSVSNVTHFLPGTLRSADRKSAWPLRTRDEFIRLFDMPTTGIDMVLEKSI